MNSVAVEKLRLAAAAAKVALGTIFENRDEAIYVICQKLDEAIALTSERRPRRRLELRMQVGADDTASLLHSLRHIVSEIEDGGTGCACGGPSSGFTYALTEEASITHESYIEAVRTYLAAERAIRDHSFKAAEQVKDELFDAVAELARPTNPRSDGQEGGGQC